ncbi:hypothetical protein BV210_18160 (plasmid) [Halorientalis sp. IM1011]|uniref:PqqD family protein n=1 Tax=Halorientalis sp. IM1011 TaxID=1932360 RepID=UPI00097CC32E|nr:PqqD family protein [Halorientalis sp. IM1011]AQL44683.1 hypothetical protein BV210_18160 [Halorientalis sp. IM1011]
MSTHGPESVPVRDCAEWSMEPVDGTERATITWQLTAQNRLDRFLFDLFGTDRERELTLDPVGSTVWQHCDGDHTVAEIASIVADEHDPERVEPVDETLSYFLVQLDERDLLSFRE